VTFLSLRVTGNSFHDPGGSVLESYGWCTTLVSPIKLPNGRFQAARIPLIHKPTATPTAISSPPPPKNRRLEFQGCAAVGGLTLVLRMPIS